MMNCNNYFEMTDQGDSFETWQGLRGPAGTTFTPAVSSAGVISWTNNGGLPNPSPVDIRGPQGEPQTPSDATPLMDGAASAGISTDYARGDHRHPSDYNKAPVIIDTASGAVASFPDGADGLPLVSLTAQIEPVQDLHGYSKPWPGGGGNNLFPPYDGNSNGLTATKNNDGTMSVAGTFTLSANRVIPTPFNVTLPAGTYTLSGFGADVANNYGITAQAYNNSTGDSYRNANGGETTFTLTAESEIACRIFITSSIAQGVAITDLVLMPMLVMGSMSVWEPYENFCPISGRTGYNVWLEPSHDTSAAPSVTVLWQSQAGTVYGGTVRINESGNVKLLAEKALLLADGSASVISVARTSGGTYYVRVANNIDGIKSTIENPHLMSDRFTAETGVVIGHAYVASDGKNIVAILPDQTITTVEAANAWFGDNPTQFVYDLAEPVEYDLSDVTVLNTLMGQNNIWADCGDVTVEYRADTKLYIDKEIAAAVAAL